MNSAITPLGAEPSADVLSRTLNFRLWRRQLLVEALLAAGIARKGTHCSFRS
jgi:hypothetical protein